MEPVSQRDYFEGKIAETRTNVEQDIKAVREFCITRFDAQDRALAALAITVEQKLMALVVSNKETAVALASSVKEAVRALEVSTERDRAAMLDSIKLWNSGHEREHALLNRTTGEKAVSMDKRLDEMNDLRSQITGERGMYATVDTMRQLMDALTLRMEEKFNAIAKRDDDADHKMDDRLKVLESLSRYQAGQWGGAGIIGGLVLTLTLAAVGILLHFVH